MAKPADSLPRKTLARRMVSYGWSRADAIIEIAYCDAVSAEEAGRRYDVAMQQHVRRAVGQIKRKARADSAVTAARDLVLIIADFRGQFSVPEDLPSISLRAGWGSCFGPDSTGRAYREFVLRLEREGMLAEQRDEDDKLVAYTITVAGRKELASLTD